MESFAAVHEFLAGHQGTFNFFFKWEGNYAVMQFDIEVKSQKRAF